MPRGNVFELVGLPYEAIENNVKPARMRTRDVSNLEDAGLTLQPADIAGDLLDVGRSDSSIFGILPNSQWWALTPEAAAR